MSVLKQVVSALVCALFLVAPALANDITDDQAELAAANAKLNADQLTLKTDQKNKAAKSVINADKTNVNVDDTTIKQILLDQRQDKREVSPN